jgi:uncharacterized membrane protein
MKFTCTVDINLPVNRVVELFDNVENMYKWQDGLQSFDHISGTPGEVGAKSKMVYKHKKRVLELEETILVKNLPDEFTATYEHIHMTNTMSNRFTAPSEGKTRWEANIEYTQFNGFMPKVMAKLFPGMFKKQTQKWLDQFKTFAENEGK